MGTTRVPFEEVLPEVTWPEKVMNRRGPDRKQRHNRKYVLRMPGFFPRFFLTIVVVQVPWLPEMTEGYVTHSWFPWVYACATISCAISSLVGPFHLKCPLGCSLWRPSLLLSNPGYLPLLFSYNISIMVFTYGVFGWYTYLCPKSLFLLYFQRFFYVSFINCSFLLYFFVNFLSITTLLDSFL